jgi:hypothetical protein
MGRRKTTQEITIEDGIDATLEIEEIVADSVVEISSDDTVEPEENSSEIETGQLYAVIDNGEVVASVYDNSAALDELLEYNKKQLDERINFLLETVSDEAEIVAMNIKGPTNYISWRQYQVQNGLTPTEPPITTRYNYYLQKYSDLSVEEMAIKVYGILRYSFTPIEML